MYTWGDYNDPEIVGALAETDARRDDEGRLLREQRGPHHQARRRRNGTSGFDIVVPTGPYIPQMIEKGLLQKFDKTQAPEHRQRRPAVPRPGLGPDQRVQRLQGLGLHRLDVEQGDLERDHLDLAGLHRRRAGRGQRQLSVLDTAGNVAGHVLLGQRHRLDHGEDRRPRRVRGVPGRRVRPHIKAFDSYPSTKIAEGAYTLSMAWNGDARQAFVRIADAGGNPEDWKWALGAPATELWMDNYCIPTGAPNPDAAHAWINWLLTPEISHQGPRVPRLQQRHEEHRRADRGAGPRPGRPAT